jgi:hypothetical protein
VFANNGVTFATVNLTAAMNGIVTASTSNLAVDSPPNVSNNSITATFTPTAGSVLYTGSTGTYAQHVVAGTLVVTSVLPTSVAAGAAFTVQVTLEDSGGNTLSNFTGPVTVSLASGPSGGVLGGTLTVNAVNGVATFSTLNLNKLSTINGVTTLYSLAFATPNVPTLSPVGNIAVQGGVITTTTTVTSTGTPFTSSIAQNTQFNLNVSLTDLLGNQASLTGASVSVALSSHTGGTLSGPTSSSLNGAGTVFTFYGLSFNRLGTYSLTVTIVTSGGNTITKTITVVCGTRTA